MGKRKNSQKWEWIDVEQKYGKCRSDNLQQKIRNAKNFEITDATERQRPDQMLNEGYILGKLTNRLGNVV